MCRRAGDVSEEGTPVPIPNTVVKLFLPDDTLWATAWENRKSPSRPPTWVFFDVFVFLHPRTIKPVADVLARRHAHQPGVKRCRESSSIPSCLATFWQEPVRRRNRAASRLFARIYPGATSAPPTGRGPSPGTLLYD